MPNEPKPQPVAVPSTPPMRYPSPAPGEGSKGSRVGDPHPDRTGGGLLPRKDGGTEGERGL